MLCIKEVLGNYSQGLFDVEAYLLLLLLLLCLLLVFHHLRKIWLQSPTINPGCMQCSICIYELIAPIVELLQDFERSFSVRNEFVTLVVVESVVIAQHQ